MEGVSIPKLEGKITRNKGGITLRFCAKPPPGKPASEAKPTTTTDFPRLIKLFFQNVYLKMNFF
jgi:hypothetical protein